MKKSFLVIMLFLPLLSIAQSNYKDGYVVTLKGDTLHGYIDYKEWGRNPKNISFKPSLGDKARQFGLSDINYFVVSGYVSYHAYRVAVSLNPVDISSPLSAVDTASEIDIVFLKILQKGRNITLYAYKDNLKERFYIKDNIADVPTELLYGIYQDPNSTNVIYKNIYRGQLSQMAVKYNPGSDKLTQQVQQLNYTKDDLIPVAAQINGDTPEQASLKSGNSSAIRFFAGAAFISSALKAGQYYGSPTSTSSSPKIAIGVDAIVNPGVGHLIFRIELAYAVNNYSFHDMPDPVDNIAQPETNSIKVQQGVIFITPQVIYNIYNTDRFKVFADIGYSLNLLSYPTNQVTTSQYGKTANTNASEAFDSKGEYGAFQFKAGVALSKRFEIYGAYFLAANLTNSLSYLNNLTSYQVGVNYFFGKAAR
jgi:hypothetical protein